VDVRLVQDGPMLGAFAAMRIAGLVVGRRRFAGRLGYDRQEATGPAALRTAVRWWTRNNRYLPWDVIRSLEGTIVADPEDLVNIAML